MGDERPAGDFSTWLSEMQSALRGERDADVPCDRCTACCTSSQFIHIAPDETDTLANIPRELLVAAPGLPAGHMVMGYDRRGHCPMLVDGACSVYEHRPRTCRTYDCRVFAAAGVTPDAQQIARRTEQWRFAHPTRRDRDEHRSVAAAARFLTQHHTDPPDGAVQDHPAHVALLAISIHQRFLQPGHGDGAIE